jgi:uncharacterized membrane protein
VSASGGPARAGNLPLSRTSGRPVRASGLPSRASPTLDRANARPDQAGARSTRAGPQRAAAGPRPQQAGPGLAAANSPLRHWLLALNLGCAVFLGGALLAPVLAVLGWPSAAGALYAAYRFACHEWAFRSFFLFGQQPVYSEPQLASLGVDPFTFAGNPSLGWKMAVCERDVAIYLGLLAVGVLYARRRSLRPPGFRLYGLLILPMALDGFTQLFGWRESTWELRVGTGLLFGLASAWLVLPRLDASFGLRQLASDYAPSSACEPLPRLSPRRG